MEQLKQRISEFKYGDELSEFMLERGSDDNKKLNKAISYRLRSHAKQVLNLRERRAMYTELYHNETNERRRLEWESELNEIIDCLELFKWHFHADKLKAIKYVEYLSGELSFDTFYDYARGDYLKELRASGLGKKLEQKSCDSKNQYPHTKEEAEQSRRELKEALAASVKQSIREYIRSIGGIDAFIALKSKPESCEDLQRLQALASWCYIADKIRKKGELKAVIRYPNNEE